MCSKQSKFEPTHVYANICPKLLTEDLDAKNKDNEPRRVEVSGTAESSLPPSQCVLTVIISNTKEKAEEARTSVTRRLEYVTQMLYNNGLPKSDVEVTKNMSRVNGKGFFLMEAQIDAKFYNDLHKCLQLRNIFVEKLDKSVQVLPISLHHDPREIDALRKKTCLAALSNARQKALDVCRLMGQSLGRPVFITENIIREWRGGESKDSSCDPSPITTCCAGEIDIQRRIKEKSFHVKVDVTATFDIRVRFDQNKVTKIMCKKAC